MPLSDEGVETGHASGQLGVFPRPWVRSLPQWSHLSGRACTDGADGLAGAVVGGRPAPSEDRPAARCVVVVIDTPPLTAVSDAFPLLRKVDGVIIVGRVGRNRRDIAQRLHETLTGAGAPLLGVVANGFKQGRRGGYGSYGYAYDYATSGTGPTTTETGPTSASPNGIVSADEPAPTAKA